MRLALLVLCASVACSPVADRIGKLEDEQQLLAMLFDDARSIEEHLAPDFACVSLRQAGQDRDPAASLIEALEQSWSIPVIAGSRCSLGGEVGMVLAPGQSGDGEWLRVANLECQNADHCTADVSYYVANMGAGGRTVSIERSGSDWRIIPTNTRWIS